MFKLWYHLHSCYTWNYKLAETVEILILIFCECTSLFNICFNCLNIKKCDTVDFTTKAGTVNKECERVKISLRSADNAEGWTRILSKIERNPDITLQVAVECQQLMNLKHDLHIVQQPVPATTFAVNTVKKKQNSTSLVSTHKKTSSCWNCGGWHFTRKCPFKIHHCHQCKQQRHKEGFCIPPAHKITQEATTYQTQVEKLNTYKQSDGNISLQHQVKPKIYVSKTERQLCSVTNRYCLGYNPHLTETMKNYRPASTNTYKTCRPEGICWLCPYHWIIASNNQNRW